MSEKKSAGRPAGRKKTATIMITIEPEVKDAFMKLMHKEGKTASVELGSWIREYIKVKQEETAVCSVSKEICSKEICGIIYFYNPRELQMTPDVVRYLSEFSEQAEESVYTVYRNDGKLVVM